MAGPITCPGRLPPGADLRAGFSRRSGGGDWWLARRRSSRRAIWCPQRWSTDRGALRRVRTGARISGWRPRAGSPSRFAPTMIERSRKAVGRLRIPATASAG